MHFLGLGRWAKDADRDPLLPHGDKRHDAVVDRVPGRPFVVGDHLFEGDVFSFREALHPRDFRSRARHCNGRAARP